VDEGQREAFDAFARARMGALLRFGHVLTGDREQAADLVQEALVRTALAWPRVVSKDDPEGYVRRTMVNRHISLWRVRRREVLVADPSDRGYSPADGHDADLWNALAQLPNRQRAVLVLRYYEDLTEAQTASVMGCSVGTVKSQTSKALAKMRASGAAAGYRVEALADGDLP
jgi:RNA polymerase sigma-70 factor (sigma-E family)